MRINVKSNGQWQTCTGKCSHAEKAQIHANFEMWICVGILHHPFVAGLFCHLILVSGMCC